jgi:MYXO-CTERM domain-containing protein
MSLTTLLFLLSAPAGAEGDCSPDTYENAIYEDRTCKLFGPEEFCADVYNGDCPTYDEITDGVEGQRGEVTRCGPGSDAAVIVEFSNSETGIEYYFNDAGEMIGAYQWIFEGTGWCCEGQVGESMRFGIDAVTCTPVPEGEPKDTRWSCAQVQPQTPGLLLLGAALLAGRRRRR